MFNYLNINISKVYPTLVVGTYSSGKSTLINALMGTELLPNSNAACTRRVTAILDNDMMDHFRIHNVDMETNYMSVIQATKAELQLYNERDRNSELLIEGDIKGIRNGKRSLLLIDTPGINNCLNDKKEDDTRRILDEFSEGMILYIINAEQLGTTDDMAFLKYVSEKVNHTDRFNIIFVINKMDCVDDEQELPELLISNAKRYIAECGIAAPVIIPVSAAAALLFKKALGKEQMTKKECRNLDYWFDIFKRTGYALTDYAVLPERGSMTQIMISGHTRASLYAALDNTGLPLLEHAINDMLIGPSKTKTPQIECIKAEKY